MRGLSKLVVFVLTGLLVWFPATVGAAEAKGATSKTDVKGSSSPSKKATASKASSKRRSWLAPTYADSTAGDVPDYDDPIVRAAAVEALGRRNGAVVAVDPSTGRILSVVNQSLALTGSYKPCSTIKPVIAMAALDKGLITRDTMLPVARRRFMSLTEAMAHSNNPFFEGLGRRMGFDAVTEYARALGLGEKAGYNIPEEQPGKFPEQPPVYGGVGRMSSFGEGFEITPLQLASVMTAVANGGTVYYLQYPRTEEERRNFHPMVKRQLENMSSLLPDLREGMLASVLYGTGRSSFDSFGEQTFGKTGTCRAPDSWLGWFGSYTGTLSPRLAVVVLLRGSNHRTNGSVAAEIAGRIYQTLRVQDYSPKVSARPAPSSLVSSRR